LATFFCILSFHVFLGKRIFGSLLLFLYNKLMIISTYGIEECGLSYIWSVDYFKRWVWYRDVCIHFLQDSVDHYVCVTFQHSKFSCKIYMWCVCRYNPVHLNVKTILFFGAVGKHGWWWVFIMVVVVRLLDAAVWKLPFSYTLQFFTRRFSVWVKKNPHKKF